MTTTITDCKPRVWPACLACYNDGRLVGQWVDCAVAADVTLSQLHKGSGGPFPGCEEIWCLDVEHVPVRREMGLLEAAEWGHVYEEAGPEQWPAVCSWMESGAYVAEGVGDIPSLSDFWDRFCGHWNSFREYAEDLADQTGLTAGWPEEAQRYFDWDAWVRDLKFGFSVVDAPSDQGYGVYVFRDL